ncbi:MAG TPA: MarR family winged helix-turn-helix transcriptional regulator [bacterium]
MSAARFQQQGFQLGEFLPYLVNRVGVHMVRVFTPELERFGVSLGMWRVLAALWQADGVRLVDLAHRTSMEVSTLSRTVAALRRRGLVRSGRNGSNGGDARTVQIALTAKGRAFTAQIIPVALEYEARMVVDIPPRERTELRRLLKRVYGNLDRLDTPPAHASAGD